MTGSSKRWWRDYMLNRPVESPALTWEQFSRIFLEKFLPITLREDYRRQFERLQQSHQIGYPGRHGQFQGQQSQQPRSCYTCGDPRHFARFCPKSQGSMQQQGSRAMIPAPAVLPPSQPSRGRGQASKGGARPEAESSDAVIISIVPVFHSDASALFHPGSTYSNVSSYIASYLIVPHDFLSVSVCVSTPVGDSLVVDHVYRSCVVTIRSLKTSVDLLLLDMIVRTRTTGREDEPPVPPARAARGRRRDRGRGRGRGAARTIAGAVPVDPPITPDQDQIPVVDAPAQAPPMAIVIPGLQEALAQILTACTGLAQEVSIPTAATTSQARGGTQTPAARTPEQVVQGPQTSGAPPAQPVVAAQDCVVPAMPEDNERRLERFGKLQPPPFSGTEREDALDFLDRCQRIIRTIDCHEKTVTLAMPGFSRIEWSGSIDYVPSRVISYLKAQRMVEKGCLSYLAFVRDVSAKTFAIDSIPVVLACVVSRSSLYDRVRERKYDEPYMLILQDRVQRGDAIDVTIGDDGVLRM
ncbi:uncharacterized protein [Nicotiana tomentosiformis]|uniref:uncharacterized protein n=1 Tax=Nicotiana tomentosiformis TaxID=4098 RepID=UPI00388C6FC4